MTQQGVEESETMDLQWSGDLTVRRIAELKTQLETALAAAAQVSIEIKNNAECDITLMQLLCSAHRTASRQGKILGFCGEFPDQLKMVLNLAGFSRHIGCALDVCGSCLWATNHPLCSSKSMRG